MASSGPPRTVRSSRASSRLIRPCSSSPSWSPGRARHTSEAGLGDRLTSTLGRLVLDGILEVEVDGVFRSGAAGWAPLAPAGDGHRGGRTAALSEEAIRYGQALLELGSLPAESIATRLYMYGRRPVSPALRRLVASWDPLGGAGPTLQRRWIEQPPSSSDSPWRSWQPRRSPAGHVRSSAPFKLYVSPTTETLPEAVRAVASALADGPGVLGFKVGRTVDGVARPDKMVAYFASLDELRGGADRVRDEAAGCRPHGVPFTAGVTDDGLLSWAMDPPRDSQPNGPPSTRLELADLGLDAARRVPPRRSRTLTRVTRGEPVANRGRSLSRVSSSTASTPPAGCRVHGSSTARRRAEPTMTIADPMLLPPDVELTPVEELPEEIRAQFTYRQGDHAVTRPRARSTSSIVDANTALLLGSFRTPTRIVDAVLGFASERQLDPRETLERSYPVLKDLVADGFLVPADSPFAEPVEASVLAEGAAVGRFRVVRPVQVMIDTQLYLARDDEGRDVALKVGRAGSDSSALFAHEARILRALDGRVSPRLIELGEADGRTYLVVSWHPGADAESAAAELRRLPPADGRERLLELGDRIVAAYADIHRRGVLHGDVHPSNVLVAGDGSVTVIDFGLATLGRRTRGPAGRGRLLHGARIGGGAAGGARRLGAHRGERAIRIGRDALPAAHRRLHPQLLTRARRDAPAAAGGRAVAVRQPRRGRPARGRGGAAAGVVEGPGRSVRGDRRSPRGVSGRGPFGRGPGPAPG